MLLFYIFTPFYNCRYTPFGEGIATMLVPQLSCNVNTLFLWNRNHLDYPVNSFFGHKDVILDFGWKRIYNTYDDLRPEQFQLVRTKEFLIVNETTFCNKISHVLE